MNTLGRHPVFSLLLICLAAMVLVPEIDLAAAGLLYDSQSGFFLAEAAPVRLVYEIFARMGALVVLALIGYWIWRRWVSRDADRDWQRRILYLVAVLALGPGLVVNGAFKADSGRARPHQVEAFGGDRPFTAFGMPAGFCERNCSSVSGHAAMGFYFIAFAWALRRRLWLHLGLASGLVVGLGRMMQGGHFLSDILFAGWAVYLVSYFSARWLLGEDCVIPGRSTADGSSSRIFCEDRS